MINYNIIKKIGYGTKGQVYLIKVDKHLYALKVEKLNELYFWREINFYKNFGLKYPNNFIKLIDYEIINNTAKKIYDLVDTTLDKIIYKLTKQQIYSVIIQITYSIHLLHSNNYVHGDLRMPNIGMVKTTQQEIEILSYRVPTNGWIVKLIDFGSIGERTEAEKLNDLEWYEKKYNTELSKLVNIFIISNLKPLDKYCEKHGIIQSNTIEKFIDTKNYYFNLIGKNIKNKYIPKLLIDKNHISNFVKLSSKPLELIKYFFKTLSK
jgi:serine/threonine protein kinase